MKTADSIKKAVERRSRPSYKNPARFRLDFIKENTFNRLWTVRMTRARVIVVSIAAVLALAALIYMIIVFTPLRHFVPGTLKGDLRAQYLETALKLDSLETAARANEAYMQSVLAIMKGEIDTITPVPVQVTFPSADSLVRAGDAERQFVRRYEEEERFNLSVLAPIAAEGMIFASPIPATATVTPLPAGGVAASQPALMPVASVYRGTVTGIYYDSDGRAVVTVQHPNDFVTVYSGLSDIFVTKGAKVAAAQRIGHVAANTALAFELWHNGAPLPPQDYISMNH